MGTCWWLMLLKATSTFGARYALPPSPQPVLVGAQQCGHAMTMLPAAPLQALVSLAVLEERFQYDFYMHADDDSYVRLDLILELLVGLLATAHTRPLGCQLHTQQLHKAS